MLVVQGDSQFPLHIQELLGKLSSIPGGRLRKHGRNPAGQVSFCAASLPAVHPLVVGKKTPVLHQPRRTVGSQVHGDALCLEQLKGFLDEIPLIQAQVALLLCGEQYLQQAGVHPLGSTWVQRLVLGDFVRQVKIHVFQAAQPVRMLLEDSQGILAQFYHDSGGPAGRNPKGRQERDHLSRAAGSQISTKNVLQLSRGDAGNVQQAFWVVLKNLQGLWSKGGVDFLRHFGAYPLDFAGGQIGDDPLLGGGDHLLVVLHLKLDAVFAIPAPMAPQIVLQPLVRRQQIPNGFHVLNFLSPAVPQILTDPVLHNAEPVVR